MGHCRARDVGRHRPLRSQRSWPLLRCFTVSLLHRFTWALATIISHAPPSCPSCSDERHELLLEESLEEHEALKIFFPSARTATLYTTTPSYNLGPRPDCTGAIAGTSAAALQALKMDEKKNIFPKSEAVDAWVHQLDGDLPIR